MRTLKYAPLIFLVATGLALIILDDSTGVSHNLAIFGPKKSIIKMLLWVVPLVLIIEVVIRVRGGLDMFK